MKSPTRDRVSRDRVLAIDRICPSIGRYAEGTTRDLLRNAIMGLCRNCNLCRSSFPRGIFSLASSVSRKRTSNSKVVRRARSLRRRRQWAVGDWSGGCVLVTRGFHPVLAQDHPLPIRKVARPKAETHLTVLQSMSNEIHRRYQPRLSILGCFALLHAVRSAKPPKPSRVRRGLISAPPSGLS